MLRSQKKEFVEELEEVYRSSGAVVLTHYHGLSVAQITALRKSLRAQGADFRVVKNTLATIASRNVDFACESGLFNGPTALAYSKDPLAAVKGVVEFAKSNDKLKIICGVVENNFIDAAGVEAVAKLPPLDVLRGKIIGILQAPATKIVGVLQAPATQLVRVLNAYSVK